MISKHPTILTTPISGFFEITAANTTLEFLALSDFPRQRKVLVKADPANTDSVMVGGVSTTNAAGYPLAAGESVELECNGALYCRSASTGQFLRFVNLT